MAKAHVLYLYLNLDMGDLGLFKVVSDGHLNDEEDGAVEKENSPSKMREEDIVEPGITHVVDGDE